MVTAERDRYHEVADAAYRPFVPDQIAGLMQSQTGRPLWTYLGFARTRALLDAGAKEVRALVIAVRP